MGFEVDFLAVGNGEKSGDAIAIRRGRLDGPRNAQNVIVIDGGTKESGKQLVQHIDRYYDTDLIDLVISTHCDADHASGLAEVVEHCRVRELLMHEPWNHAERIKKAVIDGRVTTRSLSRRLTEGLHAAYDLRQAATRKNVPVCEPYTGLRVGGEGWEFRILGPTKPWYERLLSEFRCVPDTQPPLSSIMAMALQADYSPARSGAKSRIPTGMELDNFGSTSAENNSSVIVLLTLEGRKLLFTGDAGIDALSRAIEYGERVDRDFSSLDLLQVPHHGSRRNLGPAVLDRVGVRLAVVSAAPDGAPKHPSPKVTNDLIRKGCSVYSTQGSSLCHSLNAPYRPGWVPATPIPLISNEEN